MQPEVRATRYPRQMQGFSKGGMLEQLNNGGVQKWPDRAASIDPNAAVTVSVERKRQSPTPSNGGPARPSTSASP